MQADLRSKLLSDPTVSSLASGGITWQNAPQVPSGQAAYSVLSQVSGSIGMNHEGRDGLDTARVQIDCFAPTFAQAVALRESMLTAICGFQGVVGETEFTAILPLSPRDFEPVNGWHRCLADVSVTYRPAD